MLKKIYIPNFFESGADDCAYMWSKYNGMLDSLYLCLCMFFSCLITEINIFLVIIILDVLY
jgi:hypothetical protein